jgi:hypothetical protein
MIVRRMELYGAGRSVIMMNMEASRLAGAGWTCILIASMWLGFGPLARAQNPKDAPPNRTEDERISVSEQRERGIARCRANRGVDCDTPEGQKEWVSQERPITDAERTSAAAARRAAAAASKRH